MLANRVICRHFSDQLKPRKPSDKVKPIAGLKSFVSNKFVQFIEGYERILEKRFPKTFKIYQVFTIGSYGSLDRAKDFYKDIVQHFQISKQLFDGKRLNELSYSELMIYFKTPKDMARVGPVLLVSALPFANYVVFPLAFMFPKQLLSSHFWSLEQRQLFQTQDHTKRLYYFRPVFRHIQRRLPSVTHDNKLQVKCRQVFAQIGSGTHPSVDRVLDIKPAFVSKPYGAKHLKSKHLVIKQLMYKTSE
ncbi:unnamed protein product [Medioppia subpectinata]|uniref:Letm1 RBD domain-containing protein n=1 Tax=Medioppia subpectinata TaxID=1979941 RepID=A0A7R9PY47_9ACAR|nr:unnamed protein product [Medioppia subpectinata]CAG2104693.1 unnamed protein product [Medioppia subpectinata]